MAGGAKKQKKRPGETNNPTFCCTNKKGMVFFIINYIVFEAYSLSSPPSVGFGEEYKPGHIK